MAFPVSHVVYAKKYLDQHPAMNADLFLLGTLFPDIRRITDEVSRYDTHQHFKKLDLNFKNLDAFSAGWKFHLWCDMRREEVLNKYGFYKLPHTSDHDAPPKLAEDENIYEKYRNWEKLRAILNNPPVIDLELAVSSTSAKASADKARNPLEMISQETIGRWYAIIAKYLEKKPDGKTMKAFVFKQRSLRKHAEVIVDVVAKLRNNSKVVEILRKIAEEII
jgi:hypothetical protein